MGTAQSLSNTSEKNILTHKAVAASIQENLQSIQSFDVKSLELFGSVARNEATESSDLDLLVDFNSPATFDRYMDLKFFLENLFKCPIDLVTKRSLKPALQATVLKEAIRVA
ncbi:nucleotidyltransferase family protein [Leptothoe sp. ISB3NOV94-8A]